MENPFRIVYSLDEIVFEGRNKAYGAYHLRHVYDKHMASAIVIASVFLMLAVNSPRIIGWIKGFDPTINEDIYMTEVTLSEPPTYRIKPPVPPPAAAKPQPTSNPIKSTLPVVVNDDEDTSENISAPTVHEANGSETGVDTLTGDNDGVDGALSGGGNGTSPVIEVPDEDGEPMLYVEQMPVFPGGTEAMYKYIRTKLKYPNYAAENGISGQVIIQFIVSRNGDIQNARIVRSLGGGCDEEALRVIKQMPKWKPGLHNGRPVPVMFTLPIKFTLQ